MGHVLTTEEFAHRFSPATHVLISVHVVDRIADENHHAFMGVSLQPMACPLPDLSSHFPAKRGLMVSGDAEDFGCAVFRNGVSNDLHDKREAVVEMRGGEKPV